MCPTFGVHFIAVHQDCHESPEYERQEEKPEVPRYEDHPGADDHERRVEGIAHPRIDPRGDESILHDTVEQSRYDGGLKPDEHAQHDQYDAEDQQRLLKHVDPTGRQCGQIPQPVSREGQDGDGEDIDRPHAENRQMLFLFHSRLLKRPQGSFGSDCVL